MRDRYHRQNILPEIAHAGHDRLRSARVAIVGCGALGCASADWLARAGVGELQLIDRDVVEITNLQRQTLFAEADAGAPKALAAADCLARVNSSITLVPRVADVNPASIDDILCPKPALVLDGADNFETRFLLNDWAVKHRIPFVYAGVIGTRGVVMPVAPGSTPCLRCVLDEPPAPGSQPTCETAGVLGPAVGIVAAFQASLAIRSLVDPPPANLLIEIDAWNGTTRRLTTGAPRPDCPCCAHARFEFLDGPCAALTATLCGGGAIQVRPAAGERPLDLLQLTRRLSKLGSFQATPHLARGTIAQENGHSLELTVFTDARAIIRGAKDEAAARTAYAKYVGA